MVDTKGEGVPLIQSHYLRIPTRAPGYTEKSHNQYYVALLTAKLDSIPCIKRRSMTYATIRIAQFRLLHSFVVRSRLIFATSCCRPKLPGRRLPASGAFAFVRCGLTHVQLH
ncbi:hypothetical protein CLV80_114100 [Yoonia maritima]|uniref:Uncharacterized protein n=1 Tax=Yoonia maritima TaxID=1435347 RepID=A0A2T0VUW6_9RHOB|nr:hypothetical protein CLV80_114100 [Yoonia maritima]